MFSMLLRVILVILPSESEERIMKFKVNFVIKTNAIPLVIARTVRSSAEVHIGRTSVTEGTPP